MNSRLRPNDEECAGTVIDGEAVIMNLANGTYYSMDKVGALIWSLVDERRSLAEMAESVIAAYDVPSEKAHADVQRLAQELLAEKLVVLTDGDIPAPARPRPTSQPTLPYEEPRLNAYTDMADLLALDPPLPGLKDIARYDAGHAADTQAA
jgi:hypothetical protein